MCAAVGLGRLCVHCTSSEVAGPSRSALHVAVKLILEEGLGNRVRRHEIAGAALRKGIAAMGLEMFPDATIYSNTVSCIRAPENVDPAAVVKRMREVYGFTLRIGTMGVTASPHFVLPTLSALELALRDLGYKAEPGAGVAAAQTVFADAA